MEDNKAKKIIEGFIDTGAEKYRMLEIKNKCIDDKINTGEYLVDMEELKAVSSYLEECNRKHLEYQYKINDMVRASSLYGLNKLLIIIKGYTQNKVKDLRDNKEYLSPKYADTWEGFNIKNKLTKFEKYEKTSIKDLVFTIQKAKAIKFGMNDEESTKFAENFMKEIEKEDIMDLSNSDIVRKKIRYF